MTPALLLAAIVAWGAPIDQGPPEPGCGGGAPQAVAFPLTSVVTHPSLLAKCYTPDAVQIAAVNDLRGYRCIYMPGLDLPGLSAVELELTRIDDVEPANISLNGSLPGALGNPTPTDMSLWYGNIRYQSDSRVCLAFSQVGVWGWVRTGTRMFQVASFPTNGSWSDFYTLVIDDRDKNKLNNDSCGDLIDEPPGLPPDYATCLAGFSTAGPAWVEECDDTTISQLRLCTMAVETDYQFYRRFADISAAEVYARFIIGATAQQLRIAGRVVLRMNYLGIHSNPLDPWLAGDSPPGATTSPCCIDAAYEFQHRWGVEDLASKNARFNLGPGLGLAPVQADMYHLMSGATMGCAVGIGKLGVDGDLYSISTGMGPVNYDNQNYYNGGTIVAETAFSPVFQVYGAAHEIGHTFGVPHTHSLRYDVNGTPADPTDDVPIDRCSTQPDGGGQDCSTTGFAQATLMSYCHGCRPEFLRNLRIEFHPQIAKCMRGYIASLPEFEDAHFVTDLGNGYAPIGESPPHLYFSGYSPGRDRAKLSCSNVPTHVWRTLIISARAEYQPLSGGIVVPGVDILWDGQPAETPADFGLPFGLPNGLVFYAQQVFVNQGVWYLSNTIACELIR